MGSMDIDDSNLYHALKIAGLDEMVQQHPKGIHMPVGERGIMLSGGQRQAVTLARALVSQPRMLLLDEPTASMDLQSERRVKSALDSYLREDGERSLIMVTHKMSMLDFVDRIVVIERGRIVADGERDSVLENMRSRSRTKKSATEVMESSRG